MQLDTHPAGENAGYIVLSPGSYRFVYAFSPSFIRLLCVSKNCIAGWNRLAGLVE